MACRGVVVALLLLGSMVAGQPSHAQAPSGRASFVVAVSEGTTLLPLARYEAGRWLNSWPDPQEDSTPVPALSAVPAAWLGRPVPLEWTLWLTGGGTARLRIVGTERSGGCVVSPKLTIEHPREAPAGAFDQVHPGLATTDGVTVASVHKVGGADPLQQRIQPLVVSLFARHERGAVDALAADEGEKYDRARARLTPQHLAGLRPTVDWLYRTGSDASATLYFEANKRTTSGTTIIRLTVRGWLRVAAGGAPEPIGVEAFVTFDEPDSPLPDPIGDVSDQIPLGVLRAGARDVWVLELPAGESNAFALIEIGATAIRELLRVEAGGC